MLFISASLVKPDGCVRFVQFSFDVLIGVYFCGLVGVYKFNIHGTVHYGRSPQAYVNQKLQIQLRFLMMSDITLETC